MRRVLQQNPDKRHRCPSCHAVADEQHRSNRAVVTCCSCGAEFTRFPFIAWLLPKAGVVCTAHGPSPDPA